MPSTHTSKRQTRMRRLVPALACMLFAFWTAACDDPAGEDDPCAPQPISSRLSTAFYWGGSNPDNWLPMQGPPVGSGYHAVWTSDTSFVAATTVVQGGVTERGLVRVDLDPQLRYSGYEFFPFDYPVGQLDYAPDRDALLVMYDDGVATGTTVADVALVNDQATVLRRLGTGTRTCYGISPFYTHDGAIAYCNDGFPEAGFFWFRADSSDSLVRQITLGPKEATRFGVSRDGLHLVFPGHVVDGTSLVLEKVPILGPSNPIVREILSGFVTSIDVHPTDPDLLLMQVEQQRADRVKLLRISTGEVGNVDVRTTPSTCDDWTAEFPRWAPTATALVFRAITPQAAEGKIWIRRTD